MLLYTAHLTSTSNKIWPKIKSNCWGFWVFLETFFKPEVSWLGSQKDWLKIWVSRILVKKFMFFVKNLLEFWRINGKINYNFPNSWIFQAMRLWRLSWACAVSFSVKSMSGFLLLGSWRINKLAIMSEERNFDYKVKTDTSMLRK